MCKAFLHIILRSWRKKRGRACAFALIVAWALITIYSQLLTVSKKELVAIPNLTFVVLDERNGFTNRLTDNRTNHRKDVTLKYDASCHVHIWYELCGTQIKSLLTYPLFPHLASIKSKTKKLDFRDLETNTGYRIYGFLSVPHTSTYEIYVKIQYISMLFWLSNTHLPSDMNLIFNATISESEIYSNSIDLVVAKKYFFDIVLKVGDIKGSIAVYIKEKLESQFELVDYRFLQSYKSHQNDLETFYMSQTSNLTITRNSQHLWTLEQNENNIKRTNSYKIALLPQQLTNEILPTCEYKPSYIIRRKLVYKSGVWETRYISMYPADDSSGLFRHKRGHLQVSYGNDAIDNEIAESISKDLMVALNAKKDRVFLLNKIVNVERVRDPLKGDRFLVELEVIESETNEISLLSKFVYQTNTKVLCEPIGFEINHEAHVNVIITVKNQGRWLQHVLDTFSNIYQRTGDKDFTLIIVDFNSNDIDLVKKLKESFIPNYILLHHDGRFYKTFAIQEAVSKVNSLNEIVLLLDLHLTIPLDFLYVVRKHTVQGKTAFSPSVFRLQCGATPQHPNGFWEVAGYGIFSVYKSDWNIFGGMNVKDFYNRWGGEDWDMLDRFLSAGYEVERLKLKHFNHIFHTKAGMWHKNS